MSLGLPSRLPGGAENIHDLLARGQKSFSFEFFPPKDEAGMRTLWQALRELEPLSPTFVSVTYGAGGSNRDRTIEVTRRIAAETTMLPMAHLTCVGHSRTELRSIVGSYAASGIRNVLVVRGDPEGGPGSDWVSTPNGIDRAVDLVSLVASLGDFGVGVAAFPEGHQEAASLDDDIAVLRAKAEAGAGFAITDMFFLAEHYASLRERAETAGVDIPILPGIMPITNLGQINRMAELSGREVPAQIVSRLSAYEGDAAAVRSEGLEIASELCSQLLSEGAPGLHFFTLNRSPATRRIYANLSLANA